MKKINIGKYLGKPTKKSPIKDPTYNIVLGYGFNGYFKNIINKLNNSITFWAILCIFALFLFIRLW